MIADPAALLLVRIALPWRDAEGRGWWPGDLVLVSVKDYREQRSLGYFSRDVVTATAHGRCYRHAVRFGGLERPLALPEPAYAVPGAFSLSSLAAPQTQVYAPCGCGQKKSEVSS